MGGYASGRWLVDRKTAVEDCTRLKAGDFSRWGLVYAPRLTTGKLTWSRGEVETGSIGYIVIGEAVIRLHYTLSRNGEGEESLSYPVELVSTPLPKNGRRWWFLCPLQQNGVLCGRKVNALYLPPGGKIFGCRHCYDLTYTSCQESHKYDSLWRDLAVSTGRDPGDVRRLMARLGRRNRRE